MPIASLQIALAGVLALPAATQAPPLSVLACGVSAAEQHVLGDGLSPTATVVSSSIADAESRLADFAAIVLGASAKLDAAARAAVARYVTHGGALVRVGGRETLPLDGAGGLVLDVAKDVGDHELQLAVRRAIRHSLAVPPSDALVLIDPDLSHWKDAVGRAPEWKVADGVLTVVPGKGSIMTERSFGDLRLHVEFAVPSQPDREGQQKGNSGVYLQRRYEVQILDSFGQPPTEDGAGAIYRRRAPDVNPALPAETWQSFDLWFHAARFDEHGTKTTPARLTLIFNGVLVHDDVAIESKTGWGLAEGPSPQPLLLQDHGSAVRFRNLWVQPLR